MARNILLLPGRRTAESNGFEAIVKFPRLAWRVSPRTYSRGMRRPQILTRNSLVQRFFLVFLLIVAVPVIVIGIAVTVGYRRFSLELASGRIGETLSRLTESIDEEVRRTTLLTATLSTDTRFSADVERFARSTTATDSYAASQLMEDRLSSFFNYSNKIGVVALYLRGLPVFLYRNNWQLFARPLQKTGWFPLVTGQPNTTVILDDLDSYSLIRQGPLLKVAVCPSADALAHGFEALVVAFRVPFLDTIADYEFAASNEELILVDSNARVILSSSAARMGTTLEPALLKPAVLRRGGTTFLVSQAAIPSAGWTLVGITNYSRVARDIDVFARLARWVLLALILLFSFYIEIFFQQVIRPIHDRDQRDGTRGERQLGSGGPGDGRDGAGPARTQLQHDGERDPPVDRGARTAGTGARASRDGSPAPPDQSAFPDQHPEQHPHDGRRLQRGAHPQDDRCAHEGGVQRVPGRRPSGPPGRRAGYPGTVHPDHEGALRRHLRRLDRHAAGDAGAARPEDAAPAAGGKQHICTACRDSTGGDRS